MMIKADVLTNNKDWKIYIRNPNIYIKKKLSKVEKKINLFKQNKLNFTLLLSGNKEIKKLNKKFRKKNRITDVLSFPFHEKKELNKLINKKKNDVYLGDIIINFNKIIKQSKNKSFFIIFDKLWIHGLSHLLGHRHKSNRDYFIMQKFENKMIKATQ
jgi:probable rRNA maturation factor